MNPNPIRKRILSGLSLLGLGAIGMYFLDPKSGHRRRAMAKDQVRHYGREASKRAQAASRFVGDRTRGMLHQAGQVMVPQFLRNRGTPTPSDDKLRARALSAMGRIPHHEPRAFDIQAHDGCITVTGALSDDEYQRLFKALRKIPGVKRIDRQVVVGDGQAVS